MSSCTSIDPLFTPYVDGELSAAERTLVDEHLRACAACYSRLAAEGAVRELMRARRPGLTSECASAQLRQQCRQIAGSGSSRTGPPDGRDVRRFWQASRRPGGRRWAPLAVAAAVVLLLAGAFLYQATHYSARLLAAELATDHVKCFTASSLFGTGDEPAAVESSMLSMFGWRLRLPEQLRSSGMELVGGRRCLYAEGRIAHLMYRENGRAVSIFMLPKRMRPEELVEVLGHEAAIWSTGDRTFVLITRGPRAEVERMAALAKAALQ